MIIKHSGVPTTSTRAYPEGTSTIEGITGRR